jgi:NitT/TauT family transport system substrate-binding protein
MRTSLTSVAAKKAAAKKVVAKKRAVKVVGIAAAALAAASVVAGCGSSSAASSGSSSSPVTLHLGYLTNITHATALVGVQNGIFAKDLGTGVTLKTETFNAGPDEVTALFSGALDAAYIGPGPAINAWQKSQGQAIRIISGAASGGASLVVRKGITSVPALKGKTLATPQLGNTQDVTLRYYLLQHGLKTDTQGGGDVHIKPQTNSITVQEFKSGQIDGGWLPEPYATQLVQAGGTKLVDERSLWPNGQFATTLLVVRTAFLQQHAAVVAKLLKGQVDANAYINKDPAAAQAAANAELTAITGKGLKAKVISAAFKEITFTNDPIASSLQTGAQHAEKVGLLKPVNLSGIFVLAPLNKVLAAAGEPAVSSS